MIDSLISFRDTSAILLIPVWLVYQKFGDCPAPPCWWQCACEFCSFLSSWFIGPHITLNFKMIDALICHCKIVFNSALSVHSEFFRVAYRCQILCNMKTNKQSLSRWKKLTLARSPRLGPTRQQKWSDSWFGKEHPQPGHASCKTQKKGFSTTFCLIIEFVA
jgi:hypothetical protein